MTDITCDLCGKKFMLKSQLKTHKQKINPCVGNKYNCEYCKNSYISRSGLRNHIENNCVEYMRYKEIKKINETIILPHRKIIGKKNINDDDEIIIIKKGNKHIKNNDLIALSNYVEKLENEKERLENEKKINKIACDLEISRMECKLEKEKNKLYEKELEHKKEMEKVKSSINASHINNGINIQNLQVNNNNTNNTNNNLTVHYIMNNYNNCGPLLPLQNYDAIMDCDINNSAKLMKAKYNGKRKTLKNKKIAFVETLLDINCNNDRLVEFIGDIIITNYKNDNSASQSLWATDIARFAFLAKVLRENKNTNTSMSLWIRDNSGEEVKKQVIIPLLKYINKLLIIYQKETKVQFDPNLSLRCIEIAKIITNGNMATQVIKYIAPKFSIKDRRIQ